MTDIFDRAAELEALHREKALERHRGRASPSGRTQMNCTDCADAIEPARRDAVPGCTRCAACQRATEARNKTMNR